MLELQLVMCVKFTVKSRLQSFKFESLFMFVLVSQISTDKN